jgi:aspartyl-tRNA(Asn)/glutamyl-tRNA(Gln) amidotransferase subunit A
MASLELCFLTIAEAGRRIDAGDLSPVGLTEALFDRIEKTEPELNAFVRLMRDAAMLEAEAAQTRAEAGSRLGPLDGIPIAVKDLYDTRGVMTAGGAAAYRSRVPEADATCVRLLRDAGAVIVGKTNTHEIAMGGTTNNAHFGATRNPWNLERVPGGSSGGSGAALAAGQCLGALGSDTGGSIRIPAAFCGVSGHKPTFGLVGRGGVMPLSWTLDHAGPMARTAEDCALMLNVLAGADARDLDSVARETEDYTAGLYRGVEGLRLAVIPSLAEDVDDANAENFARALGVLRELGASIDKCEPLMGFEDWRSPLGIINVEAAIVHADALEHRSEGFSDVIRERLRAGSEVKAVDYARALEQRKRIERRSEQALGAFDAFVLPTSPMTADRIDSETPAPERFRNTSVFDVSRQPSISVPNGFDVEGLPTGLMISTAQFDDVMALRIAHAYQHATEFHKHHPEI